MEVANRKIERGHLSKTAQGSHTPEQQPEQEKGYEEQAGAPVDAESGIAAAVAPAVDEREGDRVLTGEEERAGTDGYHGHDVT